MLDPGHRRQTARSCVSALKRKGDNLNWPARPRWKLRLGFARGAQVSYSGQPVDVTPFVRGETARLKVGQ
ncbi:DUF4115 domain-containing protein [Pseudomonas aeruginosa]|nr:DUF4115 domain-containing protein [Pseudomonas aeruginosa]